MGSSDASCASALPPHDGAGKSTEKEGGTGAGSRQNGSERMQEGMHPVVMTCAGSYPPTMVILTALSGGPLCWY